MLMNDFLLAVVQNPVVVKVAGGLIGAAVIWLIDNKINFPHTKKIALEIVKLAEKETVEGTNWDNFLDSFIAKFEREKGRQPRAGELKTALDLKNKVLKFKRDSFQVGGKF